MAGFEILDAEDVPRMGGARRGAGRMSNAKRAAVEAAAREMDEGIETGLEETGTISTAAKYAVARARKETALAAKAELDLKVQSGEYLSRTAFREATATLLAELAQGLRSLPDTLERKYHLSPEVVQAIGVTIDEAMADTAAGLELFFGADS